MKAGWYDEQTGVAWTEEDSRKQREWLAACERLTGCARCRQKLVEDGGCLACGWRRPQDTRELHAFEIGWTSGGDA